MRLCTSRGSIAADVPAALCDLKKVAASMRLGRIARTIAAAVNPIPPQSEHGPLRHVAIATGGAR
jgi:hypothetical protein